MRWRRKIQLKLRSLFCSSRVEGDLEDELSDYLQRKTEREIAAEASPEAARRLVMSYLHGLKRVKEECRDARGMRW